MPNIYNGCDCRECTLGRTRQSRELIPPDSDRPDAPDGYTASCTCRTCTAYHVEIGGYCTYWDCAGNVVELDDARLWCMCVECRNFRRYSGIPSPNRAHVTYDTECPWQTDPRRTCICNQCTRYRNRNGYADLGGTFVAEGHERPVTYECSRCARTGRNRFNVVQDRLFCDSCLYAACQSCRNCGSWWVSALSRRCPNCPVVTGISIAGTEDPNEYEGCDCGDCYECRRNSDDDTLVHYYSYKPTPKFRGKGPLFLGLELEVATDRYTLDDAARYVKRRVGDIAYLKSDSSIGSGFEIVSHPMSYAFAMSEFPWDMLSELPNLGAYESDSCGLHVHVSRRGFSDVKHMYRWMKFFYRNETDITRLARRNSDEWASFNESERKRAIEYAKYGQRGERYSAINTQNRTTLEVRVFASSLDKVHVQGALGLVAGSVEYTRKLTTEDILKRKGWEFASFAEWLDDDYTPLKRQMALLSA